MLQVNRSLLDEVLDPSARRALVQPRAVEQVEERLQLRGPSYRARSSEELAEVLYQLGALASDEVLERAEDPAFLETLKRQGRIVEHRGRWILAEEADLFEGKDLESQKILLRRYLQTHPPVRAPELVERFDFDVGPALRGLEEEGTALCGSFVSEQEEWCHPNSLEHVYRQTLSILRSQVQPCSLAEFTVFLLEWQARTGPRIGLGETLEQLEGYPAPVGAWDAEILPGRVEGYSRSMLEGLMSSGRVFAMGAERGKVRLIQRGHGWLYARDDTEVSPPAEGIVRFLEEHGASFFEDFRESLDFRLPVLIDSLAELFWAGLMTNDVLEEVSRLRRRSLTEADEIRDRPSRMRQFKKSWKNVPGWSGRWSLITSKGSFGKPGTPDQRIAALVGMVLKRYGVVAREWFLREQLPVSWTLAARALERMEWRGEVRRGVFVDQISGLQYALPEAVEALRSRRVTGSDQEVRINACDPASPYGGGIPSDVPVSRSANLFVNLAAGRPVSVERL